MSKPITVTPYLCVKGAAQALEFYKNAFGAVETMRIAGPNGTVGHAEIKIGEATIMLADEFPDYGFVSPATLKGSPVIIDLNVPDVDGVVTRAVDAGATLERPVKNEFYGFRTGTVVDPFGHRWHIGTQIEELSVEELQRRAAECSG